MLLEILKPLIDVLRTSFIERRRIRLTVHRAVFGSGRECYFINLVNLSHTREIEVTHVWFEAGPRQVPALEPDRPLPKRIKPDESWETWVDVERVPAMTPPSKVYKLARARLSTGAIVKSKIDQDVPQQGTVPGGPITRL